MDIIYAMGEVTWGLRYIVLFGFLLGIGGFLLRMDYQAEIVEESDV